MFKKMSWKKRLVLGVVSGVAGYYVGHRVGKGVEKAAAESYYHAIADSLAGTSFKEEK
jgi:hypothetical protein